MQKINLLMALFIMPVALAQTPEGTESPEDYLRPKDIEYACDETHCSLKKEDMEFLKKQNELLGRIAIVLVNKLRQCNFKDI